MFFLRNNTNYNNLIFTFLFICPIYLWGIKIGLLEARHLIILLAIPFIYNNKFSKIDLYILSLCLILFFHKIIYIDKNAIFNSIAIFIYLALLIKIIQQNYHKFLNLISEQINLFFIIFIIASFLISFYQQYQLGYFYSHCVIGCFSLFKLFFLENSHLGMISNSLIIYSLFLYSVGEKKINLLLFFIFISICFLNYSLTLAASLIFNCTFMIIVFWKKINRKFLIYLIITSIFCINLILNNKLYINKIQSIIEPITQIFKFRNSKIIKVNEFQTEEKVEKQTLNKNLSSDVWIKSGKLAIISLTKYPFGIGLNNFEFVHKKFIDKIFVNYAETKKLNIQDASFNLAKITSEFGIFSLFFVYLILKFTFSKKIDLKYKIFLLPNIFTQLLFRGAGYFNGGFIIFIIVMAYLILEKDIK